MAKSKVRYRFEGVIKSSVSSKKISYKVEPTAEYSLTDPRDCSKKWYVAFPENKDAPVHVLEERELEISFLLKDNKTWLDAHADTDRKVVFEFEL